jgi:formylglycine-generating enzyme required for sulfatase activity
MVGNVEEWTSTASNGHYAIFGGSWAMTCEIYGLPVLRRLARPDFQEGDLGFRCVRPA